MLKANMFSDANSAVLCNGRISRFFPVHRGVRKGSSLSSKLYLLYSNDLLVELSDFRHGILVTDIHILSSVQAEDIVLINTNCCNMQTMVTVCENYSIDWKFKFNPLKSIQFKLSISKQQTNIQLYNSSIQLEMSAIHVGVLLNRKLNSMERTLQPCRTLRSSALGLTKSGLHPSVISIDTYNRIVRRVCFTQAFFNVDCGPTLTSPRFYYENANSDMCLNRYMDYQG
ncbi:unnamed protein product [Mytilus edulis]|uniref:Reverse transcriptase domain-containing protein n=1 Tax=Mytilus edulis TaxID=6550 RepID=A0A8S3T846_MYTED|nr:unnamed protein product [Mytilus edulis]